MNIDLFALGVIHLNQKQNRSLGIHTQQKLLNALVVVERANLVSLLIIFRVKNSMMIAPPVQEKELGRKEQMINACIVGIFSQVNNINLNS